MRQHQHAAPRPRHLRIDLLRDRWVGRAAASPWHGTDLHVACRAWHVASCSVGAAGTILFFVDTAKADVQRSAKVDDEEPTYTPTAAPPGDEGIELAYLAALSNGE